MGVLDEDQALVKGAERFLVEAMGSSEALDPDSDHFEPELAPFELDEDAFAEVAAEMEWDEAEKDYE
jgi:predicted nucleotidyltransferase